MRELLGGKGANLAEMNHIGLPVPPGFTITTEVCRAYYEEGEENVKKKIKDQVEEMMKKVEDLMGKKFGDPSNPLLFSVRSGARASMPGMMDTILNLGINEDVIQGIVKKTGNERFA
ncbi:MAG: pyruvate, phosphate dikinase, partial [Bacteriovoracaceae bacterium]|nr:pyruvate, phosphate dikinase [Bacteriovoracaceae bacterium]